MDSAQHAGKPRQTNGAACGRKEQLKRLLLVLCLILTMESIASSCNDPCLPPSPTCPPIPPGHLRRRKNTTHESKAQLSPTPERICHHCTHSVMGSRGKYDLEAFAEGVLARVSVSEPVSHRGNEVECSARRHT